MSGTEGYTIMRQIGDLKVVQKMIIETPCQKRVRHKMSMLKSLDVLSVLYPTPLIKS